MVRFVCRPLFGALLVGLGLFVGGLSSAHAGIKPSSTVSVTPDGSDFRYVYSMYLTADSKLQSGDFFTIYDFDGLTGAAVTMPGSWTMTSSLLGATPASAAPGDDPTIANLTFTYSGPDILAPDAKVYLGDFSAASGYNNQTVADFAASTHIIDGSPGADKDVNIGSTSVPQAPEPATLAMLGIGLPLLGAFKLFRRRRAVA